MNRIAAGLRNYGAAAFSRSYWTNGFSLTKLGSALLSTFGVLWLAVEATSFFSREAGDAIRGQWRLFLAGGILLALWQNRPRHYFSCRLPGRDVTIELRVGDMFALRGAYIIGSNVSFDTDLQSGLIDRRSVQGQFTQRFYRHNHAALDRDIADGLADIEPTREDPNRRGKPNIYPVGTTVRLNPNGQTAYFVGLAELNNHGVARGTFDDLQTSLPALWYFIARRGTFERLIAPVLGTGFARIAQTRDEIIRAMIDSFIAACSSQRPTEMLTIVVPYKDFYEHAVDLPKLERYVQHVCQYAGYDASHRQGLGVAIN